MSSLLLYLKQLIQEQNGGLEVVVAGHVLRKQCLALPGGGLCSLILNTFEGLFDSTGRHFRCGTNRESRMLF